MRTGGPPDADSEHAEAHTDTTRKTSRKEGFPVAAVNLPVTRKLGSGRPYRSGPGTDSETTCQ